MAHVGRGTNPNSNSKPSKEDVSFVVLGAYDYLSENQIAFDVMLLHPQFARVHQKSRHARPEMEGLLAKNGLSERDVQL